MWWHVLHHAFILHLLSMFEYVFSAAKMYEGVVGVGEIIQVTSGAPWESIIGYSRAIRIGNRVEVAGTTAMRGDEVVGENDPYRQTVRVLQIIKKSLEKVGADLSDVVRTRIFVTDMSRWEEVGKAHRQFFKDIRPVVTIVEVKALIDPRLLVEIEAVAIISQ
jgi:enamine deaminase RidA (YjgF/YER057c/UK114 family)